MKDLKTKYPDVDLGENESLWDVLTRIYVDNPNADLILSQVKPSGL